MRLKDLAAEFDRNAVSWRVQGTPIGRNGKFVAMALAYIDARDVMDRLDEVCGPENWQDKYDVLPSGLYVCHIGIRCGDDWVWKTDGAGETQVEGKKGGISDAFKRCGVKWGIGRYLYALKSPWVECLVNEKNGKTYFKEWAVSPWDKVKRASYTKVDDDLTAHSSHHNGDAKPDPISEAVAYIQSATDLAELQAHFVNLPIGVKGSPKVIAAKDAAKARLTPKTAPAQSVPDEIDLGGER